MAGRSGKSKTKIYDSTLIQAKSSLATIKSPIYYKGKRQKTQFFVQYTVQKKKIKCLTEKNDLKIMTTHSFAICFFVVVFLLSGIGKNINLESKPISIHKTVEVKHSLAGILHNHLIF